MTHWYGWGLLSLALWSAASAGYRTARRAWRGAATGRESRIDWGPMAFAVWVTIAIGLVAA